MDQWKFAPFIRLASDALCRVTLPTVHLYAANVFLLTVLGIFIPIQGSLWLALATYNTFHERISEDCYGMCQIRNASTQCTLAVWSIFRFSCGETGHVRLYSWFHRGIDDYLFVQCTFIHLINSECISILLWFILVYIFVVYYFS